MEKMTKATTARDTRTLLRVSSEMLKAAKAKRKYANGLLPNSHRRGYYIGWASALESEAERLRGLAKP
jgi:hypothetical protein